MNLRSILGLALAASAVLAIGLPGARAAGNGTPVNSQLLYYTAYNFSDPTMGSISVSYDGNSTLTLSPAAPGNVLYHFTTNNPAQGQFHNADGIAVGPDGNLYVTNSGSQGITELTTGGTFLGGSSTVPIEPYHLTTDPTTPQLWSGTGVNGDDDAGAHTLIQISPGLASVVAHTVTDDTPQHNLHNVTQIAYDATNGKWYYMTGSGGGLNGEFGSIDLTTFQTHTLLTGLFGGHGLTFDPSSGDLIAVGLKYILQIDPTQAPASMVVSSLDVQNAGGDNGIVRLDQAGVDGAGHIYAADNATGRLVFVDYSQTHLVGTAGFVAAPFVVNTLDDLAVAPTTSVPLPSAVWPGMAVFGLALACAIGKNRRAMC
jgi:hypothetical protein